MSRKNRQLTLSKSAARTTAQDFVPPNNLEATGVQVVLNVTVASGTGGLTISIEGQDPVSGAWFKLNADPTAVTATGTYVYELVAGAGAASGGVTQRTGGVLPFNWRVHVAVGDASGYTYSVGANLF